MSKLMRVAGCVAWVGIALVAHAGGKKAPPAPSGQVAAQVKAEKPVHAVRASTNELVWVLRADGTRQCESNGGQSLEDARAELEKAGVKVFGSWHGSDGMIRIQVCGAPTGMVNAFQISREDLSKATAAPLNYREASPSQLKRLS